MEHIRQLLVEIENAPVECDGFTRLAATILHRNGIEYKAYTGSVSHNDEQVIPYHFWLTVNDHIIDYRAQMWIGKHAPHGIFLESEYPDFKFEGNETIIEPLDDFLFMVLNDNTHIELLKKLGKE